MNGVLLKVVVTSALPFSYSAPHLGNFVGSVLPADVYHKFLLMRGADAIFICGSDQHGTQAELKALREGVAVEVLAERMHNDIKELFARYDCGFTHYGRTDSEASKEVTYEFFSALNRNGYIIETESKQAYCNLDRRFLADRFIEGECPYCHKGNARGDQCDDCGRLLEPEQIINPHCNICGKSDIEFRTVKNLAIALDKLQGRIEEFVLEASKSNWTKNAVNKPLSFIKEGLKPREITRNMKWGFPVPLKGFEDTVFYVWFDNLLSYIAITKEWNQARYESYWKDKETEIVHFIGKDNIEFHAILWPGYLIGSDLGYTMPKTIRASENLTLKAGKWSKSRGIGIDMNAALKVLDSDYWRFTLMLAYPETADSEFSLAVIEESVNKLMNGKIGNLLHRALTIAKQNKDKIPERAVVSDEYMDRFNACLKDYEESFEQIKLREAAVAVLKLADLGNSIMSDTEPWALAKGDDASKKKFGSVIGTVLVIAYSMSIMLWPFAPKAAEAALGYFNAKKPGFKMLYDAREKGIKTNVSDEFKPIFAKMTDAQADELRKYKF